MQLLNIKDVAPTGAPLYDMHTIFDISGDYSIVKISVITMPPGVRVPESGMSCHSEDEYSYFVEGSLYTQSGGEAFTISKGDATLIPRNEEHYCENRTNENCTLVCVMVK